MYKEYNKQSNIFLSIVTPVSGRFELLKETIDCLANQTSKEFEFILTDDTADEHTRAQNQDLILCFAERFPNVQVKYIFTKAKLYQSRNVNQGLKLACGKFIHILHSDDLLADDTINLEINLLKEHPECACLFYKKTPFYDNFKPQYIPGFKIIDPKILLDPDEIIDHPLPSGTVFDRELLMKTTLMDSSMNFICDFDLFFAFIIQLIKAKKLLITPHSKYFGWRQHNNSISTSDMQFQKEHILFMKKIYEREKSDSNFTPPELYSFIQKLRYKRFIRAFHMLKKHKLRHRDILKLIKIHLAESNFYKRLDTYLMLHKYPRILENKFYKKILTKLDIDIKYDGTPKYQANPIILQSFLPCKKVLEISNNRDNYMPDAINLNFSGQFSLSKLKTTIEKYDCIIVSGYDANRYAENTITELLKYGTKYIIFKVWDNQFYNLDKLKNLLKYFPNYKIDDIYTLTNTIHVLRIKKLYEITNSQFNGLSIICNSPSKEQVQSIEKQHFDNYEIVSNISQAKYNYIFAINNGLILDCKFKETLNFDGLDIKIVKIINGNNKRMLDYYKEIEGKSIPMNYNEYSDFTVLNNFIARKECIKQIDNKYVKIKPATVNVTDAKLICIDDTIEMVNKYVYENPYFEESKNGIIIGGTDERI